MAQEKIGLITTLLLGVFIIVGALITLLTKRKERVVDFSLSMALGVIVMLMITDLLPEVIEHLGIKYIYLFLIFTVIGYLILKSLDHFIPDHEEEKMPKKKMKNNLVHIGIITSLALALHNVIEGMAVYSSLITNTSLGYTMTLGIGVHNIPLGMVIASTFYQSNENKSKTIGIITLVSLSTFLGGLIMFFLDITTVSSLVLGILLSITLGMLLFIVIDELIPRIKETKNKKVASMGIIIGIIIVLFSCLF